MVGTISKIVLGLTVPSVINIVTAFRFYLLYKELVHKFNIRHVIEHIT